MIAILIPVLGRTQQIRPLVDNIHEATSSDHRIVFVCSPSDDARLEAVKTGETVLTVAWEPGHADYARKLEVGYTATDEPWIFQGATDLRFGPDWDGRALDVHHQTGKLVVGTNDLGNPKVLKGKHSTHTLIARKYLERWGGTVDGSGLVFSCAYDHQWTDDEFIQTAKRRQQFAFARDSIVEHLHPHWGKGNMDDTYVKALDGTESDRQLFLKRRTLIARSRP